MPTGKLEDLGIENFKNRQTWLQERTEKVKDLYKIDSIDDAFRDLAFSLIFDININDIDAEEIVDARQDKQIDIIHIDQNQGETEKRATIHILQVKNESGFKSNVIIQIKNGLEWIFSRRKEEYERLENRQFVNKIVEIRDLQQNVLLNKISLIVYYITKGNSKDLSAEYLQEKRAIEKIYTNFGYENFEFREIGAFELFDYKLLSEESKRKIDYKLPVFYDVNKGSVIDYSTGETKAMICTTTGKNLALLASESPRDAIFDRNIRNFYGFEKKPVNQEIFDTCTQNGSSLFWFLNNGITMVCEHFDFNRDPDNPIVDLQNVQIVNGCQTAVTLREALEQEKLKNNVSVLLRIYETKNHSLTNRITLTTNNQNQIGGRDLKANDATQSNIQTMMLDRFGYYYEHKNRQYSDLSPDNKLKIIPNLKAGQAYLAIVLKKPSTAKGFLFKIWDEYYDEIFKKASVEDLLLAYMIHNYCNNKSKQLKKIKGLAEIDKEIATYGSYHIARVMGFLMTDDKWGHKDPSKLKSIIQSSESDPNYFEQYYKPAFEIIKGIRMHDYDENKQTISYYFKTESMHGAIERILHTPSTKVSPSNPDDSSSLFDEF
jgi:hypothetical protein